MLSIILAALPLLTGYTATERLAFDAGPAPHVAIETSVGSIQVKAGASRIEVVATKKASTAAGLAALRVETSAHGGDVTIRAAYAGGCVARCDGGVSFVVTVPAGTTLDLRTSVGNVSAEALAGDARIASSMGSLSASYASVAAVRSIVMFTTLGRVSLALPARTALGRVRLQTMVGRINSDWRVDASSGYVVNAAADKTFVSGGIGVDLSTATGAIYLTKT
jgi:hypothetical protein